jgi:hypothetical protein
MRCSLTVFSRFRFRHLSAPLLVTVTLALTACGGTSSTSTGTAQAPAGTTQAAVATTTAVAGVATAETTGQATAAATQAPTVAPTPTAAPKPTKTATKVASGNATFIPLSSNSVMEQVGDAWKGLKSYKMTMNIFDASTNAQTGTATIETTLPDKTHSVFDVDGQSIEVISIGKDEYVKLGDTWTHTTIALPTNLPSFSSSDILNDVATPAASPDLVSNKGSETVDGVECDVYEFKTGSGSSTTMWIGHNDHLIYKASFSDDTTRTEILFSDFNSDFDIQPPV